MYANKAEYYRKNVVVEIKEDEMNTESVEKRGLKIIERGFIPKPMTDARFNSITFPSIEQLPSGRCGDVQGLESKGDGAPVYSMLMWSDDRGKTWFEPFEPVLAQYKGNTRISDGVYDVFGRPGFNAFELGGLLQSVRPTMMKSKKR